MLYHGNSIRKRYIFTDACAKEKHTQCVPVLGSSRFRRWAYGTSAHVCACSCHREDISSPNYGRTA